MTKNKFIGHFAFRNIQRNKKSSTVIILTLSLILTALIMLFSITSVLRSVFTKEAEQQYPNVDVVVSYDEYSLSRLVNRRYLADDYANDTNFVLSFFNVDSLTKFNGQMFYTTLYSALPSEFETLTNSDINISGNEAVITASLAKARDISVGDTISFDILDTTVNYTVKEIKEDYGVFSGNSIFVNKQVLFNELFGIDYLNNLGNTLYIQLKPNVDKYDFIAALKEDPNYSTYDIYPTVDNEYVINHSNELSSMYMGLGMILVIAIFLVVASLFPVITRDIKTELGVVNTLGADRKFIWKVYLLQWLWLILIAFCISSVLSLVIINIGTRMYGIKSIIFYSPYSLALALGIVIIFIYLGALISYRKLTGLSVISQSRDKRYDKVKINPWLFIVSTIIFGVFIIFKPFSLPVNSLVMVLTSIYSTLVLLSVLIKLVTRIIESSKQKKSVFKLFQNRYLNNNKHIHQSVKVLFVSLVVIIMVFSIRTYLNDEIQKFPDEMRFSLALVNVNNYQDSLLSDVSNEPGVTNAAPAALYTNINIHFNDDSTKVSKFFVSMDWNETEKYFNFNASIVPDEYKNNALPYVILPKDFAMIYGLKLGDTISLDLNYKIKGISVVVGGFFDTNFAQIVYSNIYQKPEYQDIVKINSVFINSNNVQTTFQSLVQKYSLKMYYVLDANAYFGTIIDQMNKVSNFFMILTAFMISCFLIVVFNNTLLMFYDLKPDLAKIRVLGISRKQITLNILLEFILISAIIFIVGFTEVKVLSAYLKNIIVFVKYYKDISATAVDIVYGFILTFLMLLLSYIYYLYKINNIRIIDEMKFY